MSQPQEFGPNESDPLAVAIRSSELVDIFVRAEKKPKDFLLGLEYEMFAHDLTKNLPLQYEGEVSITSLFLRLAKKSELSKNPFKPIFEGDCIVALSSPQAVIALEPGGQIEIALTAYPTAEQVSKHFHDVVKLISDTAAEFKIALFALGVHPTAQRVDMAQVKKQRYGIMRRYMTGLDGLGLDMMTRSCAIQLNLDFSSESDMAKKMRLAARLVPFYSLFCSNSPFIGKELCQMASYRSHIWHKTDPARTGIPSIIFAENFGYQRWIDWVLDIPMYFIRRDQQYVDVAGASFRQFMQKGINGQQALVRDFLDHMSTAFTEVRLKPFIELRTPDSMPLCYVDAYTSLVWAHFYHEPTFSKISDWLWDLDHQELLELHNQTIQSGYGAKFRGKKIALALETLLEMAADGLKQAQLNPGVLEPFVNLVEKETTLSTWSQQRFWPLNEQNSSSLIRHLAPLQCPGK